MKSVFLALFPCLLVASVLAGDPGRQSDQAAIRAAALDYIEGWYTNDVARRAHAALGDRRRDVSILDVHGNAATVRIEADDWVDYLHLVRWNGEWKILNVLWELHDPA